MQARQKDKEASTQKVQELEVDNAELSRRLVEMKMTEMERINNVDQICNEMMRNAQSMERAAAAESSGRQGLGKLFGRPSGVRQGMNKVSALLCRDSRVAFVFSEGEGVRFGGRGRASSTAGPVGRVRGCSRCCFGPQIWSSGMYFSRGTLFLMVAFWARCLNPGKGNKFTGALFWRAL